MATSDRTQVEIRPSLQEIRQRLSARRRAVVDLRTPLAQAAVLLDQWVQRNFKTEGGEVGGWVPFKKNKDGVPLVEVSDPKRAPAKLLQKTGRLRLSFSPFATSKTAGIGSDVPYAKTHHEGLGVPERQLLPDKGPALKRVMRQAHDILDEHVKRGLRA